ncbi:hypothetical protein [Microbacterium sp. WCS2018Hpa-23]|uniref:hypothetical protein n=1 Tax=Microbacterium sp. WCS2018Hpa-23 TaxID=3073634 RepID=UPI00288313A2|nr:hypothetical protein [Microbacterium sp. WCS2018Hpa-23]
MVVAASRSGPVALTGGRLLLLDGSLTHRHDGCMSSKFPCQYKSFIEIDADDVTAVHLRHVGDDESVEPVHKYVKVTGGAVGAAGDQTMTFKLQGRACGQPFGADSFPVWNLESWLL